MKHMHLTPMRFVDYEIAQGGHLPTGDMRAHACWYFYLLAEGAMQAAEEDRTNKIIILGQAAIGTHFAKQRKSVALLYDLESPGDIDRYWPCVEAQARAVGLPRPKPEYVEFRGWDK